MEEDTAMGQDKGSVGTWGPPREGVSLPLVVPGGVQGSQPLDGAALHPAKVQSQIKPVASRAWL